MTFSQAITTWYAEHHRELPWRMTRNPYYVWISEIILQQTRVAQGYDYYTRFIKRFPTVEALAFAAPDEVMQQWEGLGYYSRARNLHAAARQIVEMGGFPTDYAGIRSLKGVGDYTAAAIASFVYELPVAVVDGNVYRVLARYFEISTPIDTTKGKREFAALAQSLLDTKAPALHNQAIMDFGALQCVPKSPQCADCPLSDSCQAYAEGSVKTLPVKSKKTAVRDRFFAYFIVQAHLDGKTLVALHRRQEGDIWTGLYEPMLHESAATRSEAEVLETVRDVFGNHLHIVASTSEIKHQLSHQTLHATAYLFECSEQQPSAEDIARILATKGFDFVDIEELVNYPLPRLVALLFEQLKLR